jgi:hypothetical protein
MKPPFEEHRFEETLHHGSLRSTGMKGRKNTVNIGQHPRLHQDSNLTQRDKGSSAAASQETIYNNVRESVTEHYRTTASFSRMQQVQEF